MSVYRAPYPSSSRDYSLVPLNNLFHGCLVNMTLTKDLREREKNKKRGRAILIQITTFLQQ